MRRTHWHTLPIPNGNLVFFKHKRCVIWKLVQYGLANTVRMVPRSRHRNRADTFFRGESVSEKTGTSRHSFRVRVGIWSPREWKWIWPLIASLQPTPDARRLSLSLQDRFWKPGLTKNYVRICTRQIAHVLLGLLCYWFQGHSKVPCEKTKS